MACKRHSDKQSIQSTFEDKHPFPTHYVLNVICIISILAKNALVLAWPSALQLRIKAA